MGDLLDTGLVTNIADVVPVAEPVSPTLPEVPDLSNATLKEGEAAKEAEKAPENTTTEPPTNPTNPAVDPAEEEKKFEHGGACSSSSEDSESDNEHYDEKAQAVKFKVIDIKHTEAEGPVLRKQQTMKSVDPHKYMKIEIRKIPKSRHQFLLDFCSKK